MSQEDDLSPVINCSQAQEGDNPSRSDSEEGEQIPEGQTLSQNLKKIVINQLRRLATALEISAKGLASTLRQVIEGSWP